MDKRTERKRTLHDAEVAVCRRAFAPAFEVRSAKAMYALRATARLANEQIAIWLADYDLNERFVNVLMGLYCSPGNVLPINEIGREIHTVGARLTVTVDVLERRGLLSREIDPDDRRRITVRLSRAGRRLIESAFPVLAAHFQHAFRGLSARERDLLLDLLLRLDDGLVDADPPAKATRRRKAATT